MEKFDSKKKYHDNPNPDARIGFIIYYPFQYYVYKNIYKHLEKAEFIVDLGPYFPIRQPDELTNDIVDLLNQEKAQYRILYYDDYFFSEYHEDFFAKYTSLVSVWERGCIMLDCNLNKKKINLTYGAGKELTQVRFHRRIYDLILSFGERDYKLFSLFANTKIVGNPKFDDWFDGDLENMPLFGELKKQFSNKKKTILYLPTHGDLCSVDKLETELIALASSYNIITKIHYFTLRDEPDLERRLLEKGIKVFGDSDDLLPMLKFADLIISDNSSAIFDAILADKPLVVTDFLSDGYLDEDHKLLKWQKRGFIGALTYSGSIEQVIKKAGMVVTIKSPKLLESVLETALNEDEKYKPARMKLRNELFSFNDGNCGKRAADAIDKLDSEERSTQRPIMYHAVEAFLFEIGKEQRRSQLSRNLYLKRLQRYENALFEKMFSDGVIFSVVLLDLDAALIEKTLKSLLFQKYNSKNYEIIIMTSEYEKVESLLQGAQQKISNTPSVKIVKVKPSETGKALGRVIQESKGEFICFSKSGYGYPSDWLLSFYAIYQKFMNIGGVGGYSIISNESYNLYEEFFILELAKKLSVEKERYFTSIFYDVCNNVFNQNPAGSFANMSYRKNILLDKIHLFNYEDIDLIELDVKYNVMEKSDVYFLALPAFKLTSIELKEFVKFNFYNGFLVSSFTQSKKYSSTQSWEEYNFFAPLKYSVINLMNGPKYRKLSMTGIIFISYFYRWLGSFYFKIIKISRSTGKEKRNHQDQ
jgi:CDP-glycerol glycerophosphotransferase (TagB/SpsB family)